MSTTAVIQIVKHKRFVVFPASRDLSHFFRFGLQWTVNGELRIGFFTIRHISAGEEVTFDYQFQRYGFALIMICILVLISNFFYSKKAQKCYCEAANCRGYIGSRENANILTDGSKIPKKGSVKEDEDEEESEEEDEIPEDFMVCLTRLILNSIVATIL